jgi:hypothetical protein
MAWQRSYHSILLADRSYHNPHALEGMAAAFGLLDDSDGRRQHRCLLIPQPLRLGDRPFYSEEIRDAQNR